MVVLRVVIVLDIRGADPFDQVRADIHGLVLRRFHLKMHVVVHKFVAYQADFKLFTKAVKRLNEPVFVIVVLKNIFLVDASHDDVIDAEL